MFSCIIWKGVKCQTGPTHTCIQNIDSQPHERTGKNTRAAKSTDTPASIEIQSGNSLDENKTFGIVSTKIESKKVPEHIIQTESWREREREKGREREHLCPLQTPQTDVWFQTPEKHSSCCYSKSQISGLDAKSWRALI